MTNPYDDGMLTFDQRSPHMNMMGGPQPPTAGVGPPQMSPAMFQRPPAGMMQMPSGGQPAHLMMQQRPMEPSSPGMMPAPLPNGMVMGPQGHMIHIDQSIGGAPHHGPPTNQHMPQTPNSVNIPQGHPPNAMSMQMNRPPGLIGPQQPHIGPQGAPHPSIMNQGHPGQMIHPGIHPGMRMPQPPQPPTMTSNSKTFPPNQPLVFNTSNPNAPPIYPCSVCHFEVHDNDQAILCESGCNFWFHRQCTGLSESAYMFLTKECYAEWVCDSCLAAKSIPLVKMKP